MLLPSRKPSSSYSLLKFVYVTSQLRHSLVVHPLLRKILDPPLNWEGFARSQSKLCDLNECLDGVPFSEPLLNGLSAIQACDQSDKFQQRAYW